MKSFRLLISLVAIVIISSCGNQPASPSAEQQGSDTVKTEPSIKSEEVNYVSNGRQAKGYIAYDENRKGKLPVVIVIHEWWGLTDYVKSRAKQLAALGYFAMDADLFGDGKTAANPKEAMELTKPYDADPSLVLPAVQAAIDKAATFPMADTSRMAAIGYCFGGFVVLNAAKMGAPFKAVVSFHGGLGGVQPRKGLTKADILVCQGAADPFVPETERAAFKKGMDSVGAHYTFIEYPGALHAFSNPQATELGQKFKLPIAYNAAADTASWKDMQNLFQQRLN